MPTWIWIFWAPQLLGMVCKKEPDLGDGNRGRPVEHAIGKHLLDKLAQVYPWAAYYPVRAKFTLLPQDPSKADVRDLLCGIKKRCPDVLNEIEAIGREIS